MDPVVTPGYTTSEFWITIGNTVIQAIAGFLVIVHPGFHLSPDVQKFVEAEAPFAATIGLVFYTWSRTRVKVAHLAALGQSAQIQNGRDLHEQEMKTAVAVAKVHANPGPVAAPAKK